MPIRRSRKVLFITYYYPPSIDAGSKRADGFVRYLPEYGYEPTVLTVLDGNYQTSASAPHQDPPWVVRVRERSLLPKRSRVVAGSSATPPQPVRFIARWLRHVFREVAYIPDAYRGFHAPAIAAALHLASSIKYDVVLTTSGPFTLLRIGHNLHVRTGLPWVADLRDLWVGNHFGYPYSRPRRWLDARLERRWLSKTSQITAATEGLAASIRLANYCGSSAHCIYNGFFDPPIARPANSGVLQVCYTGTLYEEAAPALGSFLAAVARLRTLDPRAVMKATFYGSVNAQFINQVRGLCLEDRVVYGGRLSREDAQRRQAEADVLLLLVPDTREQHVTVCTKTFEYLAARRHIAAIIPAGGENARVLRQAGVGRVFSPSEIEPLALYLQQLSASKRETGQLHPEEGAHGIDRFHYRSLAGLLAGVLDLAVGAR